MTEQELMAEQAKKIHPKSFPGVVREEAPQQGRRQRWIIWAAVLVLAVPLAWGMLQREVARWHAISAYSAVINNDLERATSKIEDALRWDSNNSNYLVTRCTYKLRAGSADIAIEDAEHALRLARAAAADRLDAASVGNLLNCLNNRAYACALAEHDLDGALENIDEAIMMAGQLTNGGILDTRAYIRYLLGDFEGGLEDAELAVSLFERTRQNRRTELRLGIRSAIDKRPWDFADTELDEAMAVLYQHRGLLYAKLGHEKEADIDLERAKALGYDPQNGVW